MSDEEVIPPESKPEQTVAEKTTTANQTKESPKETLKSETVIEQVVHHTPGIEQGLFDKSTIRYRNVGGMFSIITTCFVAILNAVTTHVSVREGHGWPDWRIMVIVNVGPIICSFAYFNVNKVLSILMSKEGVASKLRTKAAEIIAPPKT